MRLIDAEDLDFYFCEDVFECQEEVHRAKTITLDDLRPHGRWVFVSSKYSNCSNCRLTRNTETQLAWNYCPNCGAKMAWEEDSQEK